MKLLKDRLIRILKLTPVLTVTLFLFSCSSLPLANESKLKTLNSEFETYWNSGHSSARCDVERELGFASTGEYNAGEKVAVFEVLSDFEGSSPVRVISDATGGKESAINIVRAILGLYVAGPLSNPAGYRELESSYIQNDRGLTVEVTKDLSRTSVWEERTHLLSILYERNKRKKLSATQVTFGEKHVPVTIDYQKAAPFFMDTISYYRVSQLTVFRFTNCKFFKK